MLYADRQRSRDVAGEIDHCRVGCPSMSRGAQGRLAITVRIWVFAQRDEAGQLSFIDGYVEDVTPFRATEQALRQSEKLAALGSSSRASRMS